MALRYNWQPPAPITLCMWPNLSIERTKAGFPSIRYDENYFITINVKDNDTSIVIIIIIIIVTGYQH